MEDHTPHMEGQDHPLLKYPIVNTVFKHVRPKDLKECRLVCKTWNVLTIPFTRKAFQITIYETDDDDDEPMTKTHRLENVLQVFRSNTLGIPFGIYRFCSVFTTDGAGAEFLELCGDTIKEIMLSSDDVYKVEDVSELLKSTPNLEYFQIPKRLQSRSGNIVMLFPQDSKPRLRCLKKIYISEKNSEERNKFCPTFLEELMTAAPYISSLDLFEPYAKLGSEGDVNCTTVVEVLRLIQKLERESSIIKLSIYHNQTDHSESFELLRRMIVKPNGLRLKSLDYSTLRSKPDNYALQIITLLKDTLEDLTVRLTTFKDFPSIPNLRSLCLHLPRGLNFIFFNFKVLFPVLQELDIWQGSCEDTEDFIPESEPCPTIKLLNLNGPIRINAFNQIQTLFPNLTRLSMTIGVDGVEILRQIMSHMTQLKILVILGKIEIKWTESMDSILTGISTHALGRIRRAVDTIKDRGTENERREKISKLIWKTQSEFPSIANLTNLTHLSTMLYGEEDGKRNRRSYFTDWILRVLLHATSQKPSC